MMAIVLPTEVFRNVSIISNAVPKIIMSYLFVHLTSMFAPGRRYQATNIWKLIMNARQGITW